MAKVTVGGKSNSPDGVSNSRARIPEKVIKDFKRFGALLWQRGLISYQAGNISILYRNAILIKKRGAPLGFLRNSDIIKAPLEGVTPEASSELPTHQAIYKKTDAKAIIHCHPPHAVILSLDLEELRPSDTEAPLLIGQRIPVLKGSPEEIAEALKEYKIVIVRGHGSFAKGKSLEEAFSVTTTLEYSCYILWAREVLHAQPYTTTSSSHLR